MRLGGLRSQPKPLETGAFYADRPAAQGGRAKPSLNSKYARTSAHARPIFKHDFGGDILEALLATDDFEMIRISEQAGVITLINVFTVEPANQRRLIELLTEATEISVRQATGFVSASLHRSTDGTKVTMYAQWRSIEAYQAMRNDPRPMQYFKEALAIATFEPGIYEVVRTFTPAGE